MAAIPPPEGLKEEDYDAIHAAVVETVRGRWFLAEYARRNRVDEVQEMLAAIGRLESVVSGNRSLPPPAEAAPHLRLLIQRADEIAGRLADLVEELRETGAEAYLCNDLEVQSRAVAGLVKSPAADAAPLLTNSAALAPPPLALGSSTEAHQEPARAEPVRAEVARAALPSASVLQPAAPPVSPAPMMPRAMPLEVPVAGGPDPRLAALAAIDSLPLAEKLALFC